MISERQTAEKINRLMLDLYRLIEESVATVKQSCPADEAAAYQKAAGRVAGPIVMDVLEPLYRLHPELKPHNWD